MKILARWILPLTLGSTILAGAQTAPPAATPESSVTQQLDEARRQLAEQAALLRQMREQLAEQGKAIEQLRQAQGHTLSGSSADAARLQTAAQALKTTAQPAAPAAVAATQPAAAPKTDQPADLFLRVGSARLTPGGWADFTAIYRSTDVGSGLGTTFQSIPYNNTTAGGLSEIRFTAQGSRLSLRLDENLRKARVLGYVETDFNGSLAGNGYVSTNSDTLRLRVMYANLGLGKWDLLGGQYWSLITPARRGITPYTGDVFVTFHPDSSYQVGLTFARQTLIRAIYHANDTFSAALSVENPEQFSGSAVTFPTLFSSTETDINSSTGSGGGTTTPNLTPDILAKVALDHKFGGRAYHAGLTGLLLTNRIVTPASVTKTVAAKDTRVGAGIAADFNLELVKNLRLISTDYWSDGGGRYIGGSGPGFVVLQNASTTAPFSAALIHSGSSIDGFEWVATKKTTLSAYASAAYFQRRYAADPSIKTSTTYVGYGFPGSANSNNRVLEELSLGSQNTLWQSPSHGALQLITQSSYVLRAPWYVASGAPKNAHAYVQYINLRYIIP